ncbi:MAG TPA: hypothetical protein V6D08_04475 [Candidatus Obscuribacterales bacterium]
MSIRAHVAALKEHLENLFPGKWVTAGQERSKTLLTGIAEIDRILPRGLARQRITEWQGPASSGKTTLLRAAIANWCAAGFNVAYVDTGGKLTAADWALVEQGKCGATPGGAGILPAPKAGGTPPSEIAITHLPGKFWVVRPNTGARPCLAPTIWLCTQLIRSNAFDAVVLDLGNSIEQLSSQTYARLQSSLSRSKTALVVVSDNSNASAGWGCHTRLTFRWGDTVDYQAGISGIAMIVPTVRCSVRQDGLSQSTEVTLTSHVPNRLFTHPQVPDRRTPKA